MEFHTESKLHRDIRSSVRDIANSYDREYWRRIHDDRRFPEEVWSDLAEQGWVGTIIPEEYGGHGLGMREMVTLIEELGINGAWSMAYPFFLNSVFGGVTLSAYGSESQKEKWLPKIVDGSGRFALGATEQDAGLNTTNISTNAERDGEHYVINGSKKWTSAIHLADRVVLLTRTSEQDETTSSARGFTLFLVDPDDSGMEYEEISLSIFYPERTFDLSLNDVRVHEDQIIGEVGDGLSHLFNTLNCERIGAGAMMYGAGSYGLQRACEYANEREVFDVSISSHQAIQHPLADAYADLEVARLMYHKAAETYDAGEQAGPAANIANLKAGEAAWNAIEAAMTTFGGMSASKEMEVGRIWQMLRNNRITPLSEQMLRNYIATKELGLPKSY